MADAKRRRKRELRKKEHKVDRMAREARRREERNRIREYEREADQARGADSDG